MKKSRRKPNKTTSKLKQYRKNEEIKADKVRLILPESGQNEVISIEDALIIGEKTGLDIVEVAPNAKPPVVKLLNYDSFRYKQKKILEKQQGSHKTLDMKGMRLSPRIDDNDLQTKVKQGVKFLEKGHKVKIDINLRGRENRHADLALEVVKKYIDKISENVNINVEQKPKKVGRMINAMISKKS